MHDVVLRGGSVHDGLGTEPRTADVAIDGDRVVAVGRGVGAARRVIDVGGLMVAPGFIDAHSHSDMVPVLPEPQPFKLFQGVTTEIVGNCGLSFAPLTERALSEARTKLSNLSGGAEPRVRKFGDYLDEIEAAGLTNHMAAMVGHGMLWMSVAGMEPRLPAGGLEEMSRLADESFAAGAVGLSSGLVYTPGELVALATVAHRWNRVYATHMRDEGEALLAALDEAIEVASRAQVRLQVSHCKAAGRASHGKARLLLDKLHGARVAGVDVRGDQYPYLAGGTGLAALLPAAAHAGGVAALRARLRDPDERRRMREAAEDPSTTAGAGLWRSAAPSDILVTAHADAKLVGRTLERLAGGLDPWDVLCAMVDADPGAAMVITLMAEDDVRTIMADPLIAVGSDNGVPGDYGHPRTWGSFPRFLGAYVRELGVVSWPEAVRKMTSATARQFGLAGRGWLGPGAIADVAVFDPGTVGHGGTYEDPAVTPDGIPYVLLAGRVVVDDSAFCGERHGRVLRAGCRQGRGTRRAVSGE
ncbi:N-acyl-D-amino-acid deacylase family protein [Actinomadura madurae]|uniref:N-acyl-D-amino-acid deacylase family protein n=1 Tax=Actinomadura madurae TaxID=1993 RepID=UPI000D82F919|nr:amidohydrolase family protein [Actinomadura madurae]SPT63704.1 D-aminoacylase [Actinomadura madurae]